MESPVLYCALTTQKLESNNHNKCYIKFKLGMKASLYLGESKPNRKHLQSDNKSGQAPADYCYW